jgi:hypothetical protein
VVVPLSDERAAAVESAKTSVTAKWPKNEGRCILADYNEKLTSDMNERLRQRMILQPSLWSHDISREDQDLKTKTLMINLHAVLQRIRILT